jgi:hypothetical protein
VVAGAPQPADELPTEEMLAAPRATEATPTEET